MATPTDRSARTEIELDHDIAEVWRALVDDEQLVRWLGPDSKLSPTPGGDLYTSDMVTSEPKRGMVTGVERERRLTFDWWPVDEPDQISQVALELTPSQRGTLVTVTETPTWSDPSASASAVSACAGSASVGVVAGGYWAWRLAVLVVGCQSLVVAR
ncbi:MAG: SRPBCC domain-containing protein [Actinomycetia bacterium]|nr:SRPBCC domain-containing protein [Actinomycetes bacterium]